MSGGDIGAKNGQLTVMCGGREDVLGALLPVLKPMSKAVTHFGPAGTFGKSFGFSSFSRIVQWFLVLIGCVSLVVLSAAGLFPRGNH